jgi:hypothetical protein
VPPQQKSNRDSLIPEEFSERLAHGGLCGNSVRPHLNRKKAGRGGVWHVLSFRSKSKTGISFQASQGKNRDPISQITGAKRAGRVAQAVERLPCTRQALSSNPSAVKKKKKAEDICLKESSHM